MVIFLKWKCRRLPTAYSRRQSRNRSYAKLSRGSRHAAGNLSPCFSSRSASAPTRKSRDFSESLSVRSDSSASGVSTGSDAALTKWGLVKSRRKQAMISGPLLKKLDGLSNDAGRKHLPRSHRNLLRPAAIAELTQAATDNLHVNTRLAFHWAEAAVIIARRLKSKDDLGRSLRAKANCLWVLGENRKSVSLHERALRIFVSSHNEHEEARTLSAALQPLILLGEYDRAFAFSERARTIFTSEGETLRLASLDNNVGN